MPSAEAGPTVLFDNNEKEQEAPNAEVTIPNEQKNKRNNPKKTKNLRFIKSNHPNLSHLTKISSKMYIRFVRMVGLPGFEPGSIAPEATSLDQASRKPHMGGNKIVRLFF